MLPVPRRPIEIDCAAIDEANNAIDGAMISIRATVFMTNSWRLLVRSTAGGAKVSGSGHLGCIRSFAKAECRTAQCLASGRPPGL